MDRLLQLPMIEHIFNAPPFAKAITGTIAAMISSVFPLMTTSIPDINPLWDYGAWGIFITFAIYVIINLWKANAAMKIEHSQAMAAAHTETLKAMREIHEETKVLMQARIDALESALQKKVGDGTVVCPYQNKTNTN